MDAYAVACGCPLAFERKEIGDGSRSRHSFGDVSAYELGRGRYFQGPSQASELARFRRRKSLQTSDNEARQELLTILQCKKDDQAQGGKELLTISPPSRSGNPLVKDGNFLRQATTQPSIVQCNSRSAHCRVAASAQPLVRVEGFSPASTFASTVLP